MNIKIINSFYIKIKKLFIINYLIFKKLHHRQANLIK